MNSLNTSSLVITIIFAFTTASTQAEDYGQGLINHSAAVALDNAQGRHRHWRAIGRLHVNQPEQKSRCTGSLIDSRDSDNDASGPAYILTSGHCVTRHALNAVSNLSVGGYIDFDYFVGGMALTRRYALKTVMQATMRGGDLAIIELNTSLQTLIHQGLQPLSIAPQTPAHGLDLMIVGAPSGHEDAPGLRLSVCLFEATKDLVEGVFVYRGFYKHRCQGVAPGSSGSPVLERHSNRIIGVLGTSTSRALEENRCQDNAPCEVQDGQPVWAADTQYSSPAHGLKTCFKRGIFDASDAECIVHPSLDMTLGDAYSPKTYSRVTRDASGQIVLPTWSWPFTLDMPLYRYKTTRTPSACESPHHYSNVLNANNALIDDPVGPETGLHFLCIIGVDSASQRPARGMMNKPVIVAMELAAPGPTQLPQLTIERSLGGGYSVTPRYSNPALWVYQFKFGPPEAVQCEDSQGYAPYFDIVKTFSPAQLPLTLCSKVYDMSRQASLPRVDRLEP